MSRFRDLYLPERVPGYPSTSMPRWSNEIVGVDSGAEAVNRRWAHPLRTFVMPDAVRDQGVLQAVSDMWLVMAGTAYTFPFRDAFDFASVPLQQPNTAPPISMVDQAIGTGDGFNPDFQLQKTYTLGAYSYVRPITLPIVASVLVSVNTVGAPTVFTLVPATDYSVDRESGVVHFTTPPAAGVTVKAGFYFDCRVRFESDDAFQAMLVAYRVGGFASLTLLEQRSC